MPQSNETEETFEWSTVVEQTPTQIVLETPGEFVIAEFVMIETIQFNEKGEDKEFSQIIMRGKGVKQGEMLEKGEVYSYGMGNKLKKSAERLNAMLHEGVTFKLTYVKDVDTGAQQPMKDVKIEVAK